MAATIETYIQRINYDEDGLHKIAAANNGQVSLADLKAAYKGQLITIDCNDTVSGDFERIAEFTSGDYLQDEDAIFEFYKEISFMIGCEDTPEALLRFFENSIMLQSISCSDWQIMANELYEAGDDTATVHIE